VAGRTATTRHLKRHHAFPDVTDQVIRSTNHQIRQNAGVASGKNVIVLRIHAPASGQKIVQEFTVALADFRDKTKDVSWAVLLETDCAPRLRIFCFFCVLFKHEVSEILHGVLHVKPAKACVRELAGRRCKVGAQQTLNLGCCHIEGLWF